MEFSHVRFGTFSLSLALHVLIAPGAAEWAHSVAASYLVPTFVSRSNLQRVAFKIFGHLLVVLFLLFSEDFVNVNSVEELAQLHIVFMQEIDGSLQQHHALVEGVFVIH